MRSSYPGSVSAVKLNRFGSFSWVKSTSSTTGPNCLASIFAHFSSRRLRSVTPVNPARVVVGLASSMRLYSSMPSSSGSLVHPGTSGLGTQFKSPSSSM